MATTSVSMPIAGGTFLQATGTTAMANVEIAPGVFFNLVTQQSPNHSYVWISTRDGSNLVNSPAYLVRTIYHQPNSTRLFKLSNNRVMVFYHAQSASTSNVQVFTVNPVDNSITFASRQSISYGGNNAQYVTDIVQADEKTFLLAAVIGSSSTSTGQMVASKFEINSSGNVANTLFASGNSSSWGFAQWQTIAAGQYMLVSNFSGTVLQYTLANNTLTSANITSLLGDYRPYLTKLSNGDMLGVSTNGVDLIYKTAAGVTVNTKMHNTASVFESAGDNYYGVRRLITIDNNHFVMAALYSSLNPSSGSYATAMVSPFLPSRLHLRYFRKINLDVWEVSDSSKMAGGLVVNLPTTDANDANRYKQWCFDSRGLDFDSNFDAVITYANGTKITNLKLG